MKSFFCIIFCLSFSINLFSMVEIGFRNDTYKDLVVEVNSKGNVGKIIEQHILGTHNSNKLISMSVSHCLNIGVGKVECNKDGMSFSSYHGSMHIFRDSLLKYNGKTFVLKKVGSHLKLVIEDGLPSVSSAEKSIKTEEKKQSGEGKEEKEEHK